ncbi:hypothetical protein FRC12_022685 [Ceratobasidium sp. 428]|nr:hypothetical protein FRC12_022685 [Ceratobasidium sp. 428]
MSQSLSKSRFRSPKCAWSRFRSGFASKSGLGSTSSWPPFASPQNSPIPLLPPSCVSDHEGDPLLLPGDPEADARLCGEHLTLDRQIARLPPLRLRRGADIDKGDGGDGGDEDGDGGEHDEYGEGGGDEGGGDDDEEAGGGDEDEEEGAAEPQIRVPPHDKGGPADWDGPAPAGDIHLMLRNIYFRAWAPYGHATHDTIQATPKSHQLTLRAAAQYGASSPELVAEIDHMPLTLRSFERQIGMDLSESITVYVACPIEACGKQDTLEQIAGLPNPRYSAILYTKATLTNGARKRTPTKTFPLNSLPDTLGRLLSRHGVPDSVQLWRGPDNTLADGDGLTNAGELANANIPPPQGTQQWLDTTGSNQLFGAISKGWKWRTEAMGLRRRIDEEKTVDEAVGEQALALSQLRLGLSLNLNLDG